MTPDEKADVLEHYMEARLQEPSYPTVAEIAAGNADLDRPYRSGVGALFVTRNDGDREVDGKLRKLETMPDRAG